MPLLWPAPSGPFVLDRRGVEIRVGAEIEVRLDNAIDSLDIVRSSSFHLTECSGFDGTGILDPAGRDPSPAAKRPELGRHAFVLG